MKEIKDPARYLLRWKAKDGVFEAYDRVEKESKILGDKVPFLVLDELISVRGVTPTKEPIYSNEIRDLRLEELTVKSYAFVDGEPVEKTLAEGFWDEIRPPKADRPSKAKDFGQKYCKVVYCAFWDGEIKFGKMELTGMAVGGWIEFTNSVPGQPKGVTFNGVKSVSTPNGEFYAPVFAVREISKDTADKAAEFKSELHKYFQAKSEPVIQVQEAEEDEAAF